MGLILFTDGSVNTQTRIGYGAYLITEEGKQTLDRFKNQVVVKRFENTTSTQLELQALLWALGSIESSGQKITIYTDSQNIVGLTDRRKRLEQNDYYSTKNNRRLKNHLLYKQFFEITDKLNLALVKVKGHQVSDQKDNIDRLFTLVDRASRKALRNDGL